MPTTTQETRVSLDDLLATQDRHTLDQLLRLADNDSRYSMHLDVSWSYWHYGRHAEFASELDMPSLASLFSAAWQIEHRVHVDDEQAAFQARQEIAREYA
jgi:cytosine/adenosine deaminase-related metal-dependent hydrolase